MNGDAGASHVGEVGGEVHLRQDDAPRRADVASREDASLGLDPVREAEGLHHDHCVGLHGDPGARLSGFGRAFQDERAKTAPLQGDAQGEAADAGAARTMGGAVVIGKGSGWCQPREGNAGRPGS